MVYNECVARSPKLPNTRKKLEERPELYHRAKVYTGDKGGGGNAQPTMINDPPVPSSRYKKVF